MTVLQAIIMGIIQGLTEFLPVSSSAHLLLAPKLFGWSGDEFGLAFDVALHVGTLLAVLWYFRRDWIDLARAFFNVLKTRRATSIEERRAIFLIVALVPAIAAALILGDAAENAFRNPLVTAWALIIFGVVLWGVDRLAPATRPLENMRIRDALLIGLAQMLALVPGVSRSGSTMTAGRLLAFDRTSAARFSFLMSMSVIAAAAVHKVPDAIGQQGFSAQLLAGTAAAAITGWLAIGFLLRFLTTHGFGFFAVYRIVLGIIVIIVLT